MPIDPSTITWDDPAPSGLRPLGPPPPRQPKEPRVIKYERGNEIVTEQLGPDGSRTPIATAPRQLPPQKPSAINAEAASKARDKFNQAVLFRKQLQEVNRLWKETQQGGGLGGIMEFLPTPRNKEFDVAASGLKSLARSLFKVPGDQMTEFEGKPIMELIPNRWSFDEANIQRINQLDALAREIIAQNAPLIGRSVQYHKPKKGGKPKRRVINFDDLPE